jgi:5-methylcytosine-specific restriction endonuclease McrA
MRSYSQLLLLESFDERLSYLQLLDNNVTSPRHMSAGFYQSRQWKEIRKQVIDRDLGFDLGIFGVYIEGPMYVHHINPIDENDIRFRTRKLLDLDNLITVSDKTHKLIHYRKQVKEPWIERRPGDTKLW